jgi:uncharacterized protein YukJ|tara:strand:- start:2905 stop:3198 length:294 start_codon:yes stop_codon:yes gene_type:complete
MIVRRCAHDHDVVIHKNNKPGMTKAIKLANGEMSTIVYPSAAKDYFLWVDGEIIKRSDSFVTIENAFVSECKKKHDNGHGRIDMFKHKIINNKVVSR